MEFLRLCLPACIRQALEELPESLDGTYARILQDIDKANWKYAHRIFQCVAVASRPLCVKELGEFLAFDFDAGPTPAFRADWRPEDPLNSILSTCSSLLAVVKLADLEVIQFSHFSVKEFLVSTRLAETKDPISHYHVSTTPAHTLVAQACLGTLLHLDENITSDSLEDFPLTDYAAEYWVDHARFEKVSANTQVGMKHLFDPRKRHISVWLWIFDPDAPWCRHQRSTHPPQPRESCLYYAALFGFHQLIAFLVVECSQDVDAMDSNHQWTPLHVASRAGHVEFARVLVGHGADVNAQGQYKSTPLHLASQRGHVDFAWLLVEHGADVDSQDDIQCTPLHLALKCGHVDLARVLVELGADVNAKDSYEWAPLHQALKGRHVEFALVLVERGADVTAQNDFKSTPLHIALDGGHVEFARMLIERGADVNVQDYNKSTPLHFALEGGHVEFAQVLIEHDAFVNAQDGRRSTPLHLALDGGHVGFSQVLIEHGADVNAKDHYKSTPLHLASQGGHLELARVLVEHGADVNSQNDYRSTPLHLASRGGHVEIARVLVEHGANVNAQDFLGFTPSQRASRREYHRIMKLFLAHGAEENST